MAPGEQKPTPSEEPSSQQSRAHANLRTFGRYTIEKKVGEGGMGAVYRAIDANLKRTVALKVLPKEKAENELLVKRFQSEAQAAAQLRHKNIVCVYDAGEIDGYLYIAMEYLDGIDVHDLVQRKGPLSAKRSLDIIKQTARALEHAWAQTIVHRDIKPANLLIDRDGNVKLADMGLARSMAETEEAGITRAGTTVGTVDYMSPEQARDSKSADCRSDMYSLGATWYQMLVGTPPFPDGDLLNKITAHATQPPPDPRDSRPKIPESLVRIMHRMMAKDPDDRYQTPTELLHDLEHGYSGSDEESPVAEQETEDKVLSLDVLAGLAEDDSEDVDQRKSKRRKKPDSSSAALAAAIFDDVDDEEDADLPDTADFEKPVPKKSGNVSTAPKSRASSKAAKPAKSKKKKTSRQSSPSVSKAPQSSRDTVADDSPTASAIPSVREAMLARNVHSRRKAEDRKQLAMMIAGFAAVCLAGYFIVTAVFGGPSAEQPPETPAAVAPE